jgi:hypothetical protein
MLRRIVIAIGAAATLAIAGCGTVAHNAGTKAFDPHLRLTNGSQYVGADCITSGCAVKNVGSPGRTMTWNPQGTNSDGFAFGYWQFSNGNYMASNDLCSGVTVRTSATSNGVVWTWVPDNDFLFANRYCSMGANNYSSVLGSDNQNGHQWFIGNNPPLGGQFIRMKIFA